MDENKLKKLGILFYYETKLKNICIKKKYIYIYKIYKYNDNIIIVLYIIRVIILYCTIYNIINIIIIYTHFYK